MKHSVYLSPARLGILTLTLVAVALGGTSDLGTTSMMILLGGAVLLVAPPRRPLGRWPHYLLGAFFLLALTAFLPAAWSWSTPLWRQHLEALGTIVPVALPATRTVQPWLTVQACCQLFVGMVWAYYVLSQSWDSVRRLEAAQLIVSVVAILAALATAAFCLGFHVPTWNQPENRGWFPNRNHTADVLALCGVVNYALIYDALRKGRKGAWVWFITLFLICAGLVVSYSRAGVLMFFGGIFLWHAWPTGRRNGNLNSAKWMTLSAAFVVALLTLFLLFGGDTLARFQGVHAESVQADLYRVQIQKDALRFSGQSPWLGVGLGNFEPLFASARQASANENRAIHPESDWLWVACEMGWFAPLILVAGIIWWLRRSLPFHAKPGESLRRAFVVAGILFILHGLVDVAGHHFGSLWMGLLVLSLGMSHHITNRSSRIIPLVFRGLAVLMLVVGGWWMASTQALPVPPTTADLDRLTELRDHAIAGNQFAKTVELDDAALRFSPVDWHLYYQRGYAEAFEPGQLGPAAADFLAARNLESKWVEPCFHEGELWLSMNQPDLCFDAWHEALRRSRPEETADLYRRMVELSGYNDLVHADLLELAKGKLEYQLIFLAYAPADEAKKLIGDVLAAHPDLKGLDAAQRETFFNGWWEHGDRDQLMAQLTAHPDWIDTGWLFLARAYAAQKDFQHAWGIVAQHGPPPAIPSVPTQLSVGELQHAFYDQNENLASGIMLALAQKKLGQTDHALATLDVLAKQKNCPKFVFYLEAQLWASKQEWELAWQAWSSFQQISS